MLNQRKIKLIFQSGMILFLGILLIPSYSEGFKIFSVHHPREAKSLYYQGKHQMSQGNKEKAIEYFEKALSIALKKIDPENPGLTHHWNALERAFESNGDNKKAINYFEKMLDEFERKNLHHHMGKVQDIIASFKNR